MSFKLTGHDFDFTHKGCEYHVEIFKSNGLGWQYAIRLVESVEILDTNYGMDGLKSKEAASSRARQWIRVNA